MERDTRTSSLRPGVAVEEKSAGGKLKRKPARRSSFTPYSRPQEHGVQQSRWLSKLMDPARSIIAGGANLIYNSIFSKRESLDTLSISNSGEDHGTDESDMEVEPNTEVGNHNSNVSMASSEVREKEIESIEDEDEDFSVQLPAPPGWKKKKTFQLGLPKTEVTSPSRNVESSKAGSHFQSLNQDRKSDLTNNDCLSGIEQLMKDKQFSRDDINRLIGIMNSRAVDLPRAEQEANMPSMALERAPTEACVTHDIASTSTNDRLELSNKTSWIMSTPRPQSVLRDAVGASPVDIARAYMGNRTSEIDHCSNNSFPNRESIHPHGDTFALRPYIPSPSPKPSACWPGAQVEDARDYTTPRSQQGGFGLHKFSRTPYSRLISKSKSEFMRLQIDSSRPVNNPSTPMLQSGTPIYGQLKSRNNGLGYGHGSVGPIRRMRHKFAETPIRASANSQYAETPLQAENVNFSESMFPTANHTTETRGKSGHTSYQMGDKELQKSKLDVSIVHPHSSQIAKKIFEKLNSFPATPKEKSAEIQRATTWKKHEKTESENRDDSLFKVPPPRETYNQDRGAVKRKSSVPDVEDGVATINNRGGDTDPLLAFGKTQKNSQVQDAAEEEVGPSRKSSEAHNLGGSSRSKPLISITKPEQKWSFSADTNSGGFTFPVSSSSHGILSEPPTPSLMPSSTGEESSVATYSFGSKRGDPDPPLVFTFPCTSNEHDHLSPNIQFDFGSDKGTKRVCFSSLERDAVCH